MGELDTAKMIDGPVRSDSSDSSGLIRVNWLSLTGAAVGVIASALPWFWTRSGNQFITSLPNYWAWQHTWDLPIPDNALSEAGFSVYWLLFLLGSLASLLTTLGVLLQGTSLAALAVNELHRQWLLETLGYEGGFYIGFVIALVSVIAVAASFLRPFGVGFRDTKTPWRSRIRVFNWPKATTSPRTFLRAMIGNRSWIYVWLVVVMVLSGVTVVVDRATLNAEPLDSVADGVALTIGPSFPFHFPWDRFVLRVFVTDEQGLATWTPMVNETQYLNVSAGTWALVTVPSTYSNLSVSLVMDIIDTMGDGRSGPGDQIIIRATNGTDFEANTEYTISIQPKIDIRFVYSYTSILIRPIHPYPTIQFVMHEGELQSWVSVPH